MTCYVISGPTASGKSDLALSVAKACSGEIVCMDSMQIYRHMDIGTAKPTQEERRQVPHHMLDVVEPWEPYSVAAYRDAAESCASAIFARGHIPVFCGGTGFYLRALRHPMAMGGTAASAEVRSRLEKEAREEGGAEKLHERLTTLDPVTGSRLHVHDVRRVIRALEVQEVTGIPFSCQPKLEDAVPTYDYRVVCLNRDRGRLYDRIERRVDSMVERGLADEVEKLISMGVSPSCQSMQAIGYKEMLPYIRQECSLEEAKDLLKRNTRHYAKRQLTWMRREEDVLWLDADMEAEELQQKALAYLEGMEVS